MTRQQFLDLGQSRTFSKRPATVTFAGNRPLKRRLKDIVIELLNEHRIMSISTNRLNGWPQTTIVSYVNDGFMLYCFVACNS